MESASNMLRFDQSTIYWITIGPCTPKLYLTDTLLTTQMRYTTAHCFNTVFAISRWWTRWVIAIHLFQISACKSKKYYRYSQHMVYRWEGHLYFKVGKVSSRILFSNTKCFGSPMSSRALFQGLRNMFWDFPVDISQEQKVFQKQ